MSITHCCGIWSWNNDSVKLPIIFVLTKLVSSILWKLKHFFFTFEKKVYVNTHYLIVCLLIPNNVIWRVFYRVCNISMLNINISNLDILSNIVTFGKIWSLTNFCWPFELAKNLWWSETANTYLDSILGQPLILGGRRPLKIGCELWPQL